MDWPESYFGSEMEVGETEEEGVKVPVGFWTVKVEQAEEGFELKVVPEELPESVRVSQMT